jgi:hypothetical protein
VSALRHVTPKDGRHKALKVTYRTNRANPERAGALPGGARPWLPRLAAMALVLSAAVLGTTSCAGSAARPPRTHDLPAARTRLPSSATSVLTGAPDVMTAALARTLFASAPVVVVADASRAAGLAAAVRQAGRTHAPLLLASSRASAGADAAAALRAGIRALHPRAVLAPGVAGNALSAQLPGVHVVTAPGGLPATHAPAPVGHVVLLVHQGDSSAATIAAITTAHAAGAQVITVHGYDPGPTRPPSPRSRPLSHGRCSPLGPDSGRWAAWPTGSLWP